MYSLCPVFFVVVALNEVHQTLFEPGSHCVRMQGLPCEPGRLNDVPKPQTLWYGGSNIEEGEFLFPSLLETHLGARVHPPLVDKPNPNVV